ncbi:NAD(P)H-dependent oxidoreductase [Azospirillum sp. RWY-5-1]|uniref:NAD(P)H-dependent oxidoreductase n=1 Tax=Azospirillum oleiclasticum TaxID=2735135 RepID=A0ABX2THH2_9PROT|nr:NAD(P)H-dependent oxidoreductase [Azospirillum oleiclasticum]NYZ15590.1 NAD(P)H-dependent oxidoreductase [Azospirillum oleiclasticum]NYZ22613.1 NAD(P)H-dependent oxidoreductase [Azospirillum oleiclasticum]
MIRVLGISGSLRRGSYNTALLRAVQELAPAGMTVDIHDIADVPLFNDDVLQAGFPPAADALRQAMRAADAVVFATPEYNRSIPGVLKNAIDWASRGPDQPFDGKPVAIMGASRGLIGTALANHHLRQILVYLNAFMVNGPEVLVGGAPQKFDGDGRLTDEPTRQFVAAHLVRLEAMVRVSRELKAAPR